MKLRRSAARVGGALAASAFALASGHAGAVTCSAATTSVAFGAYNVFSAANVDSTGTVTVTCSKQASDPSGTITVNYEVELGTGTSGNVSQRTMTSGGATLNYNLYTNNARNQLWGNGVNAPSVSNSFNLTNGTPSRNRTHNVFGRIPPLQDASVGSYADNVLVTIQY
jgi:spore coat protein U-like protein